MKKMLSLILAIFMIFSSSTVAFATELESDAFEDGSFAHSYDEEEYFRFKNPSERMTSTGEFEIYCNSYLDSDTFEANSNQITIEATCKLYNRNTRHHTKSSREYTIAVHKVGGSDLSTVLTGKLNGETFSQTVNVEQGEQYYLIIRSSSSLDAVLYMDGEGSVSPVTKVN